MVQPKVLSYWHLSIHQPNRRQCQRDDLDLQSCLQSLVLQIEEQHMLVQSWKKKSMGQSVEVVEDLSLQ